MNIGNDNVWDHFALRESAGATALRRMLDSGRCYWREVVAGEALRWSDEVRALSLDWERQADASLLLHVEAERGGTPMLLDPPCYLDTKARSVGPLDTSAFNAAQLASLLAAPRLPESEAERLTRALLLHYPDLSLPPPLELPLRELGDVRPAPVLELRQEPFPQGEIHMARLFFDYAGLDVEPLPQLASVTREQADGLVRVHRDPGFEQACRERMVAMEAAEFVDPREGAVAYAFLADGEVNDIARWHQFLEQDIPQLQAEGWQVRHAENFQLGFHEAEQWWGELEEEDGEDWFSMSLDVEIEGKRLPLLPLLGPLLQQHSPDDLPETVHVPLGDGQYLSASAERVRPWLEILYELYGREPEGSAALRLSRFDAARLPEQVNWLGGERLRELGRRLREFEGIESTPPPAAFKGTLRDY